MEIRIKKKNLCRQFIHLQVKEKLKNVSFMSRSTSIEHTFDRDVERRL